jgi:hypothetical protein
MLTLGAEFMSSIQEFPPFRLDVINQHLWRTGKTKSEERILLKPKAFAVLAYLVEHAGQLVTQKQLLEGVWRTATIPPARPTSRGAKRSCINSGPRSRRSAFNWRAPDRAKYMRWNR